MKKGDIASFAFQVKPPNFKNLPTSFLFWILPIS